MERRDRLGRDDHRNAQLRHVLGGDDGRSARLDRLGGERLAVDASFGLYLGWVSVATLANLGAAIVSTGVAAESTLGEVSTVAALVAVLGLATFYVWRWKNLAVSAAIIWGVAWVGFGRLSDAPESTLVGVVALAVAVLIAVTGLLAKSIDWRSAGPSKGVGTTRRADAIA